MSQISFANSKRALQAAFTYHLQKAIILVSIIGYTTNASSQRQEYFPDPNPVIQKKLEDWQDLKFGLLMHWGAYSQWGIVYKFK